MEKPILFGFLFLLIGHPSLSQNQDKSAILQARKQGVMAHYEQAYVAHILTGKKYDFEQYKSKSHPMFLSKRPQPGTLVYDGVLFKKIDIEYNLFDQQVVVLLESKNNERYVSIDKEKISAFSIDDYRFLHVRGDSVMKDGIYQHAFEGKNLALFIKNRKSQEDVFSNAYLMYEYHPKKAFYVKNSYGTFQIRGKKSLLKAFQDAGELAGILKSQKIKIRKKGMERQLLKALSHFDAKIDEGK